MFNLFLKFSRKGQQHVQSRGFTSYIRIPWFNFVTLFKMQGTKVFRVFFKISEKSNTFYGSSRSEAFYKKDFVNFQKKACVGVSIWQTCRLAAWNIL